MLYVGCDHENSQSVDISKESNTFDVYLHNFKIPS